MANKATKQDLANISLLSGLIKEKETAQAVVAELDRQFAHQAPRLAGLKLRELRMSLNTDAGKRAREELPQLQALQDLFYQQMIPPNA